MKAGKQKSEKKLKTINFKNMSYTIIPTNDSRDLPFHVLNIDDDIVYKAESRRDAEDWISEREPTHEPDVWTDDTANLEEWIAEHREFIKG